MTRTLLLVHAHPDDEVLSTGATMAKCADAGDRVVLVTCTRGEMGEIVVDDLAHLAATRDDGLGEHRAGELVAACRELGVARGVWLGGEGRWRDSDMVGEPGNDDPRCFHQADLGEAAEALLEVIVEEEPNVVITYNAFGGYGHPDHVKAHLVTHEALRLARERGLHQVAKVYETGLSASFLQSGIDLMAAQGLPNPFGVERATDLPFVVPDEQITTVIDASAFMGAKLAAMRAHRSQLAEDDPLVQLAARDETGTFGIEQYTLVVGQAVGSPETDLFAGLA